MSNNQGKMQKVLDFMAGKGFYVILFVCIAAIGISGYMLFFGGESDITSPNLEVVTMTPTPKQPSSPTVSPGISISTPSPSRQPVQTPEQTLEDSRLPVEGQDIGVAAPVTDMPSVTPTTLTPSPAPAVTATPTSTPKVKKTDFFWPVNGLPVSVFAPDDLLYNETMGDWRTHNGLDLETDLGALVMASADGTVLDIFDDDRLGTTVIIGHDGGYTSHYSNLQKTATVIIGQIVEAGDTIGGVGNTAEIETLMTPHLHFEIRKDSEQIDPLTVLPLK